MSRHYLLDGYNIIKQMPALADLRLEDGRAALLRWINAARPQGSVNNKVTVVFDGNPAYFGFQDGGEALVVFSQYGSADDEIKAMVDRAVNKKNIVVVSNDKSIVLYARALGAGILSVSQFAGDVFKYGVAGTQSAQVKPGQGVSAKNIPLQRQDQINKEMRKIWGINE